MNIISDLGAVTRMDSSDDISVWKSIFPEWSENDQSKEHLRLSSTDDIINENSASRKVLLNINDKSRGF